jgi:phospholipid/cholesterol/gamma-HCH transport system substrate-binding protein
MGGRPRRRKLPPPWARDYDERVYHRGFSGPTNRTIGLITLVVIVLFSYLAIAKTAKLFPFEPHGVQLSAVFESSATLQAGSPVRIAGVNVGSVLSVAPHGDASEVTFDVSTEGQPVHADATVEIRPRLFLEGNFFLDLTPGSPRAPALGDGGVIPVTQTSTAVQLDEVLTALQAPQRQNLQQLLDGLGTALTYQPTASADATQDPSVQGESAAQALNDTFAYGGPAGRDTAIVNQALLGERPHDLSGLIAAQRSVFTTLAAHEAALGQLIVNFNLTAGAFAAEASNLSATVRELAPTAEQATPALVAVNDSLPDLRRFALTLEPSLRELGPTIEAGRPWLTQTRRLLSKQELGFLAPLLRRSAPGLAEATANGGNLFGQLALTARCASDVLVPTGNIVVDNAGGAYPITTGQPNVRELFYAAVGIAGESQAFDGNGSYVRFQPGGGPVLAQMANPNGGLQDTKLFAHTIEAPVGTRPLLPNSLPPYRPDYACYRNPVPDVNGATVGPPLPQQVTP